MKKNKIELFSPSAFLLLTLIFLIKYEAIASQIIPSFNCKRALTTVERTICSNAEIALLDRVLDYIYKVLEGSIGDEFSKVRKSQIQWLKERPINQKELKVFYKNRIQEYLANKKNLDIIVDDIFLDCNHPFDDIHNLLKYFDDPIYISLIENFISSSYLETRKNELNDIIKKEAERELSLFLIKILAKNETEEKIIEALKKQKWLYGDIFKTFVRIDLSMGLWLNNSSIKIVTKLFPNIKELNLNCLLSGDSGLEYLNNLENLEILHLRNSRGYRIGVEGLKKLQELINLKYLDISGNPATLTESSLQSLKKLTNLRQLNLTNIIIDEDLDIEDRTREKVKNILSSNVKIQVEDNKEETQQKKRSWRSISFSKDNSYQGIDNIKSLEKMREIDVIYAFDSGPTFEEIQTLLEKYPRLNIEFRHHS